MKFTIVIPSYNQAPFLRATLDSVLRQERVELEVLVFDGGSTDGSVDILREYGDRVRWVSEPDDGQTHAINKGLMEAAGEIVAYLNSDDIYYSDALRRVAESFEREPKLEVVYGDAMHLNADGSEMEPYPTEPWDYTRLFETCYLCQPAVFWKRDLLQMEGLLDDRLQYAMDYEYWLRLGKRHAFHYLKGEILAGSRLHEDTKTLSRRVEVHHEILEVVQRHGGPLSAQKIWMRHLAYYEASQLCRMDAGGKHVIPQDKKRLAWHFAASALQRADEFKIALSVEDVRQLRRECAGAGLFEGASK